MKRTPEKEFFKPSPVSKMERLLLDMEIRDAEQLVENREQELEIARDGLANLLQRKESSKNR